MKQIHRILTAAIFLFAVDSASAKTLSFSEVWREIDRSSPAHQAAQLNVQAAEEARSRSGLHWLPRIYLDGRVYRTDDPGSSFLGLLEQRKVTSADFDPGSLNNPDAQTYTRGALGVDLPLFEGGMKKAQVEMYDHSVAARKLSASQVRAEQYSSAGISYASIVSVQENKKKIQGLSDDVSRLIRGYQLGQKSNPVGYSGLLGMRSLAQRLSGLLERYEAVERAHFSALKEMGLQNSDWTPETTDVRRFVDQYFSAGNQTSATPSFQTAATDEDARAAQKAAAMEKAKYLPRVGAFAESYVFDGSRDTATGYTAGLYLQWNLFNPNDYGSYKEADLKALAADKFSQAMSRQENAERAALQETKKALHANLLRLEQSDRLLEEQTKVSSTLFRNGSISALQFVEILNRRADLIAQQIEVQLGFIQSAAAEITKRRFDIPVSSENGDRK